MERPSRLCRERPLLALLLFLTAASHLAAQSDATTVREVVDNLAAKLPFSDKTRVLGAQIEDSLDQQTWMVQLHDPNYKSNRRLIGLKGGKVISDDAQTLDTFRDMALVPLEAAELTGSATSLRGRAHASAKAAGIEPKSYRYVLFHPEEKTAARWHLYAYDGQSNMVGRVALNAGTSEVLASTWGAEAIRDAQSAKRDRRSSGEGADSEFEEFGRDVERTFKGIGADLEEFFTGKRTIDK